MDSIRYSPQALVEAVFKEHERADKASLTRAYIAIKNTVYLEKLQTLSTQAKSSLICNDHTKAVLERTYSGFPASSFLADYFPACHKAPPTFSTLFSPSIPVDGQSGDRAGLPPLFPTVLVPMPRSYRIACAKQEFRFSMLRFLVSARRLLGVALGFRP